MNRNSNYEECVEKMMEEKKYQYIVLLQERWDILLRV